MSRFFNKKVFYLKKIISSLVSYRSLFNNIERGENEIEKDENDLFYRDSNKSHK